MPGSLHNQWKNLGKLKVTLGTYLHVGRIDDDESVPQSHTTYGRSPCISKSGATVTVGCQNSSMIGIRGRRKQVTDWSIPGDTRSFPYGN